MTTVSSTGSTSSTSSTSSAKTLTTLDASEMQDRFLKLLVAQLNNQDPMNPMDNAQMTSQMAQINTVTGISQLNETMKSMSSQFMSMQILQGANMIGHQVMLAGDTLSVNKGVAAGAVELSSSASSVTIELRTPGGQVIDTFDLGAREAGQHAFTWDASAYQGQTVKLSVSAKNGSTAVSARPMTVETVESVSSEAGVLKLNLLSGKSVSYSDVAAIY